MASRPLGKTLLLCTVQGLFADVRSHISEETKNASYVASRAIFWSAVASALIGFPLVILFLFCLPSLDVLYSLDAPQPFVSIYAMSMGQGGHVFMNVVCIIGLIFNTTVAGVASSRLIWAVARDGVLPFSGWISQVSAKKEPRNAIIVMHAVAALLLCTILASPVAFTSLVSAAGVPTITAYALIACKSKRPEVKCLTQLAMANTTQSAGRSSRLTDFDMLAGR